MNRKDIIKPDFFIIGVQKCGTTWLWKNLELHPGTDMPAEKEIHFFGGVENYRKGLKWYYSHFSMLDPLRLIGEASTTYFFDRMPYWYNQANIIEVQKSLPTIPELIKKELPEIKIIIILRDPVWRAVSAYKHWHRKIKKGAPSPFLGLKKTALKYPKWRILECGYYARYLKLWEKWIEQENMKIFIFEEAVLKTPQNSMVQLFDFLGLDSTYIPWSVEKSVHKSWTLTRIIFNYYLSTFGSRIQGKVDKYMGPFWDRFDFLKTYAIKRDDINFLRSVYLPEKEELEKILGQSLSCWNYGNK